MTREQSLDLGVFTQVRKGNRLGLITHVTMDAIGIQWGEDSERTYYRRDQIGDLIIERLVERTRFGPSITNRFHTR